MSKGQGKKHKKKKRRKRSKSTKSKKDSISEIPASDPQDIMETVTINNVQETQNTFPQQLTVATDDGRCKDCLMEHCGKMQQNYDHDRTPIDFRYRNDQ